jgi:hypothetical protein
LLLPTFGLAGVEQVADAGVQRPQHKIVGLDIPVADVALVTVYQELQHTLHDGGNLIF